MGEILIVSGHTDLDHSVANRTILTELAWNVSNLNIDLLDTLYPDYKIDVKAEQDKLSNAKMIILQYPVCWYSMPSLLEKWMEVTFLHGFSHGATGDKLRNKKLIASFTTGASEASYSKEQYGFEIEDLLLPIKATCKLCNMEFAGYVYSGGVSYRNHTNPEDIKLIQDKARLHAGRLIQMIQEI